MVISTSYPPTQPNPTQHILVQLSLCFNTPPHTLEITFSSQHSRMGVGMFPPMEGASGRTNHSIGKSCRAQHATHRTRAPFLRPHPALPLCSSMLVCILPGAPSSFPYFLCPNAHASCCWHTVPECHKLAGPPDAGKRCQPRQRNPGARHSDHTNQPQRCHF